MYFKIERLLSNELYKKHIDWDKVQKIIEKNHECLNEIDDKECDSVLSECIGCFYKKGNDALRLVKLFIQNGFDPSLYGGKNGASCLHELCWSLYDQYVLDIAEIMLDGGANASIKKDADDEKGVLNSIEWRLGYWSMGDFHQDADYFDIANTYEAYYLMIERQQEGKDYHGIRAFRKSVGHTIEKVEEVVVPNQDRDNSEARRKILLYAGNTILEARDYVEFVVNPYANENIISSRDVSDEYDAIIGAKIRGLRYSNSSKAFLNFENGHKIIFEGEKDGCVITVE